MRIQYFQGTKTAKEIAAHPLFASYNLTEAEVAAILASPGVSAPAAAAAPAPAPVTSPSSFDKLKLLSPSAAAAALEKPPVKEAKVELKLNMQLNEIQDRAKFSSEVSEDIAKAADIKKESVRVEGLRAGSVLVDLVITATEGGKDAAAVAFGLEAQARDKSSALFKGKHTSKTDGLGLKLDKVPAGMTAETARKILELHNKGKTLKQIALHHSLMDCGMTLTVETVEAVIDPGRAGSSLSLTAPSLAPPPVQKPAYTAPAPQEDSWRPSASSSSDPDGIFFFATSSRMQPAPPQLRPPQRVENFDVGGIFFSAPVQSPAQQHSAPAPPAVDKLDEATLLDIQSQWEKKLGK